MREDTSKKKSRASVDQTLRLEEVGLPVEELVRRGARDILQRAIELEVQTLLAEYEHVQLLDGRRAVVRNGYLPSREILTGIGPVEVQVPKVRDRSGSGIKFSSSLVPAYVRRTPRVSAALPWLYLKGISSGDLSEALQVLLGDEAKGLSPNVLGRLKAQWAEEYRDWNQRSLTNRQYVYWWADGIYTSLREDDDERLCLLVIIGVTPEGKKEWVGISDGFRESTESWLDMLRELKERGLSAGPRLAVGDGALGFWNALEQVYPETSHQRCWFHKSGNVLSALPKSLQSKAKADLQAIWMAPTHKAANVAFERFLKRYRPKYPKATEKLVKDRDALLAFYAFPAEHWSYCQFWCMRARSSLNQAASRCSCGGSSVTGIPSS
jgi:transposase-like protein